MDLELLHDDRDIEVLSLLGSGSTSGNESSKLGEFVLINTPKKSTSKVVPEGSQKEKSTIQSEQDKIKEDEPEEYDLVIVGSGVSGLYALFTILTQRPDYKTKKIRMIEQSGIIGGRLRTDIIKDPKYSRSPDTNSSTAFVACEEGGMRFCIQLDEEKEMKPSKEQVMPCLVDLIVNLRPFDVKMYNIERFKMVPEGNVDFRKQMFSGQNFSSWYAQQNPGVWTDIFSLDKRERDRSPDQIFAEVYEKILKENYPQLISFLGDKKAAIVLKQQDDSKIRLIQDTAYWYNFRKYFSWNNVPIYRYTMRSLMTVMGYSQGCIRMLEMQGFQSFTLGRGNAGTIIQMDRTHKAMSDSFYCFTYGFSALIEALEAGINNLLGQDGAAGDNWVWLNQQVTNIKLAGGAGKLSGDFDTELSMKDISKDDGNIKKIKAKELILAIPRKSIESIEITKIPHHGYAKFRELINSVVDINMTKINLYFDESWWNKDYGDCRMYGSSTTDLPIAQVYPFYPNIKDEDAIIDPHLCALTIYCDVENSGFWSDLQHLPGVFTSDLQEKYPELKAASLEVVQEALRELRLLFNVKNIPYPVLTTYTRWAGDADNTNPVAIHQWKRDVDDRTVRRQIVKPFPDSKVFVCNEAWSEFQGWVEGSLMSTKEAVEALLKNTS